MPALLDRCRRGACVAALLAVALGGCAAVGPDYSEPQLAVPAGWSAGTGTDAMDAVLLARWWHGFGDPVLDRLVADALAANLDLAQARARLREARARRGVAGAALAPSVDASLSGSRSRSSGQSGSGSTRELYSAGFDASWELDVFGGLRRSVEAAQADLEASVESLSDTRVSLAAEVALNHHEKWDGSGYPAGREGSNIPLCGRIVAVADFVDALGTRASYRTALDEAAVFPLLDLAAGVQFDPAVVSAMHQVRPQLPRVHELAARHTAQATAGTPAPLWWRELASAA